MRADFYWILFLLITSYKCRKGKREMETDRRAKRAKSERLFT